MKQSFSMKKTTTMKRYPFLFLCCMVIVLAGCSDSSTSSEPDTPPILPSQLTPALIDLSYFSNQDVPMDEDHQVFKAVETMAYAGGTLMQAGGALGIGDTFLLFMNSTNQKPEFSNGSWIWSVTIPFGFMKENDLTFNNQTGEITVKIVATPVSGGLQWEIRYSGLIEDEFLNDFRLISGFTSDDEMNGEWNFYLPEGGSSPVLTYKWEKTSATEFTVQLVAVSGSDVLNVDYRKDGPENWMTYQDNFEMISVYWNENSDSGWIEQDGQRSCYANFQNAACS